MPPALCEPILAVPQAQGESAENLALMRRIDELFLKYPFQSELVRQSREGEGIGRARAD